MNMSRIAVAAGLATALALPAQAGAQRRYDFTADAVGKEPSQFVPMVGNWVVTQDEGRRVLLVDGRIWRKGQPSGGLADKARAIYGAEHEEFLDNVKQFAYFPIAVHKDIPAFENGVRSQVRRGTKAVPLELGTWNELRVVTKGANVKAYLNGELMIDENWTSAISGKVGLWSKTDSMTEFDAFTVTPEKP